MKGRLLYVNVHVRVAQYLDSAIESNAGGSDTDGEIEPVVAGSITTMPATTFPRLETKSFKVKVVADRRFRLPAFLQRLVHNRIAALDPAWHRQTF